MTKRMHAHMQYMQYTYMHMFIYMVTYYIDSRACAYIYVCRCLYSSVCIRPAAMHCFSIRILFLEVSHIVKTHVFRTCVSTLDYCECDTHTHM